MDNSDGPHKDPLRRKAEEQLQDNPPDIDEAGLPPEKIRNMLHDLRVHQLELEMQNEELRSTQLELQTARDKFVRLYNQAPVGYLSLDKHGLIRQFNQTFMDMTGFTETEINGVPLADLMDHTGRETFLARYRALFKDPRNKNMEVNLRTPSRKYLPVRLAGRIEEHDLQGDGKDQDRYLLLIVSDITEQKQAREEIQRKKEQLEKTLAEKDRFFSILAHDLKSPLSGFLSSTRIMAEDINSFSLAELQNVSANMQRSAENLYSLLENLLTWARMQKGDTDFEPDVINLHDLVRQNMELSRSVFQHKEIIFESRISPEMQIYADSNMIGTVLRNLLSNAGKYTHDKGRVIAGAEKKNGGITVYIQDSGSGMDQKTLQGLFQMNSKATQPGTRGESGTGLGLLLCREMIHRHQGEIWARSAPGKGTTFFFTLPDHQP